jgi:hypothetical protein
MQSVQFIHMRLFLSHRVFAMARVVHHQAAAPKVDSFIVYLPSGVEETSLAQGYFPCPECFRGRKAVPMVAPNDQIYGKPCLVFTTEEALHAHRMQKHPARIVRSFTIP